MELVLFLLGSNIACVAAAVMRVSMIRARLERETAEIRAKHVAELEKGKRYLSVMRHELGLDGAALVLACQELASAKDEEGSPLFPGDASWKNVRAALRKMALDSQQRVRIQVVPTE